MPIQPVENSAPIPSEQPSGLDAIGLVPAAPEPASPGGTPGAPAAPLTGQPLQAPAAPATEQPWSAEQLQQYPGLAKFKSLEDLIASYTGFERTFHGFRQRGLDPEVVLEALSTEGTGEGADEALAGEHGADEGAGPTDPLDDPSAFLDSFATNPRELVRNEARAIALQVLEDYRKVEGVAQHLWDEAKTRYPDIEQHEAALTKALMEMPEIVRFPDAVDRLYRIVVGGAPKADALKAATDAGRAEGIAQVTSTTVESGRVGGSPAAPASGQGSVVEEILAGSTSPSLVMRPV